MKIKQNSLSGEDNNFNKEIYLTTSKEYYCIQPIEKLPSDQDFKRRRDQLSAYVDAKFRGGVFVNGSGVNPYGGKIV